MCKVATPELKRAAAAMKSAEAVVFLYASLSTPVRLCRRLAFRLIVQIDGSERFFDSRFESNSWQDAAYENFNRSWKMCSRCFSGCVGSLELHNCIGPVANEQVAGGSL
jgi:hypothetical protein